MTDKGKETVDSSTGEVLPAVQAGDANDAGQALAQVYDPGYLASIDPGGGPDGVPLEAALVEGNLALLSPPQRVAYFRAVCASLGLNPLTKPFDYIELNGRLVLYATRACTEQLRRMYGVSIKLRDRANLDGVFSVVAVATAKDGRTDEALGAVNVAGLRGEALANALMKAETKAKRRVTLSICGLGVMDESEIEGARYAESQRFQEQRSSAPRTLTDVGERHQEQLPAGAGTQPASGRPAPPPEVLADLGAGKVGRFITWCERAASAIGDNAARQDFLAKLLRNPDGEAVLNRIKELAADDGAPGSMVARNFLAFLEKATKE